MGDITTLSTIMESRGMTRRDEFGAQQVQTQAETSMAAVAAREQAVVQAHFIMAERHPRRWMNVRQALLEHCDRYGFASVAMYAKPVGREKINGEWVDKFAEGLSTKFAQTARQEMGNCHTNTQVVYEDDRLRIIKASVTDFQRNNVESREIPVAKVIEKRGKKTGRDWLPPEGREVISERLNSYGDPVYLCVATGDEVMKLQNAEISKAHRDETLRMIPDDIKGECEARIRAVVEKQIDSDPKAALKQIADAFAKLRVMPSDLETYLGCPIERATPAQIKELRGVWAAINDGNATFDEVLKAKYDNEGKPGGKTQSDVAKEKLESLSSKPTETKPTADDEKLKREMEEFDKKEAGKEKDGPGVNEPQQESRRKLDFSKR